MCLPGTNKHGQIINRRLLSAAVPVGRCFNARCIKRDDFYLLSDPLCDILSHIRARTVSSLSILRRMQRPLGRRRANYRCGNPRGRGWITDGKGTREVEALAQNEFRKNVAALGGSSSHLSSRIFLAPRAPTKFSPDEKTRENPRSTPPISKLRPHYRA